MDAVGKVFVVTGAGNGIGRQVAIELVRRGGIVAGADLNEEGLAETATLVADVTRFSAHRLDVGDRDAVEAFPAAVIDRHGQVDGLFNIAGIAQEMQQVIDTPMPRVDLLIRVNLLGTIGMTMAFLPHLLDRPRGVIMNTSSMSAIVGVPGAAIYGATKAAVAQFGYGLAQDLRGRTNVSVTTVIPGTVWTDLVRKSALELGTPEALAKAFAAQPDAVARKMVSTTLRGRRRVLIGKDAHVYEALSRVSLTLADRLSVAQVGQFVYRR